MSFQRSLAASVMALALLAAPIVAQQRGTITGQVTDGMTGQPLAGAQVVIEGTNFGALANAEGRYLIANVPAGSHTVRAILIGFGPVTQEVSVSAGQTAVANFTLETSAIALDAVVVTATGEQRKRELGHSIGAIQASEVVEVAPVKNMADLLQGRTAGVQVFNSSGTAGMGSRIRIRGSSSISLSNEPLIYVDGVRVDNRTGTTTGTGGQDPSRLDDFNPEDIESIEIVKGPAASTLYGTEAANGVIRITTKRGRPGETRWSFWAENGLVQERNKYPLNYAGLDADGGGFAQFCLLDFEVAGLCTQDGISTYQVLDDPEFTPFDDGLREQYGMSVTGGSERINYYVSAEVEDEAGPYKLPDYDRQLLIDRGIRITEERERPNQLERVNLRMNLNSQLAEDVTLAVRAGYVTSDLSFTGNDNNSFGFLPSAFFGGAFPNDTSSQWGFQRPATLFGRDMFQKIERVTGSVTSTWQPNEWLTLRGTGGLDYTNRNDISFFARDLGVPGQSNLGRKDTDYFNIWQYTFDASGTGSFDVTPDVTSRTSVGVQFFRNLFTGTQAWGIDIVNGASSIGAAAQTFSSESQTETKTAGLFVEQQFGWLDRLFVTGAIRADDNSAFGQDFDLIYYPKLSASWIASEEEFFPQIGLLDQLRVRAAWGKSGLQPGSTDAILTLDADPITDPNDNTISGVSIGEIGNNLLEPEESSELELGLDADLWGGRLGLEFTYYDKNTSGALVRVPLAPSLGASSSQWVNLGEVENKGYEAAVSATVLDMDQVTWDLTVAGSINRNKLLDLGGAEPIGSTTRFVEGYPLGGQWEQPLESWSDADGNGIITDDELVVGTDLEYHGPGMPEKEMSLTSSVYFLDNFRLYALFDYRGDYLAYNNTERFRCRFRLCRALIDRTTPLDDQARAVASLYHSSQTVWGYQEEADFVKLREVSLTYTLPSEWASSFRASRASLTLTGRNLKTWTDYTGMDPEINSAGAGDNFGISEFLTQPPLRYWTLRVNLGF